MITPDKHHDISWSYDDVPGTWEEVSELKKEAVRLKFMVNILLKRIEELHGSFDGNIPNDNPVSQRPQKLIPEQRYVDKPHGGFGAKSPKDDRASQRSRVLASEHPATINSYGFVPGNKVILTWDRTGNIFKGTKSFRKTAMEGTIVTVYRVTKEYIVYLDERGNEHRKRNHNVELVEDTSTM